MSISKPKPKPVHYVDNKKFYEAIVAHKAKVKEYEAEGKQPPILSNYIGECIWKIASKLSNKPCFMNYSFREEMVEDGIENCLMYFKDFDITKTQNPFAYFTQIIYYAFLRRIFKEEKIRYTTYKYFHDTIITQVGTENLFDHDDKNLLSAQMYDNISTFMDKFEKRELVKKEKRKETKQSKLYEEENEYPAAA